MQERQASTKTTGATDQLARQRGSRQVLSDQRLARKRELDRQAQRIARVKTKNLIAHLEGQVEALTQTQGNGDIKALIDQIEEQRKENETLRSTLNTIGKLIGSTTTEIAPALEAKNLDQSSPSVKQHSPNSNENGQGNNQPNGGPNARDLVASNNRSQMAYPQNDMPADICSQLSWMPPYDLNSVPQFFEPQLPAGPMGHFVYNIPSAQSLLDTASMLARPTAGEPASCCCNNVRFGNELVSQCSKLRLQSSVNQAARDADMAIRAVLHGWNAVTSKYALDPVWATLRHADESMFSKCDAATERLVCLRLVCLTLRYQVNPTEQNLEALPLFLRARPSQTSIQHAPLIDYLVWPGLRERFVFNPHRYCSEKNWNMFWQCFRFNWEYDFRDAYIRNRQTGLYQFSTPFLERLRDLQCFRMLQSYLDEFPEFQEDIPPLVIKSEPESFGPERARETFHMEEPELSPGGLTDEQLSFLQMGWGTQPNNGMRAN